jgi:hypothetical protein
MILAGLSVAIEKTFIFIMWTLLFEAGWSINVMAGFVKKQGCSAILGRNGFFDNFKVTFDHSTAPPAFEIERINRA